MDAEWTLVTLQDALAALEELVGDIEAQPEDAEAVLAEQLPSVYAKLNYAWHSRLLGPEAIESVDHDVLVSWPLDLGVRGPGAAREQ